MCCPIHRCPSAFCFGYILCLTQSYFHPLTKRKTLSMFFFCVIHRCPVTLRSCRSGSCRLRLRESGAGRARSLPSLQGTHTCIHRQRTPISIRFYLSSLPPSHTRIFLPLAPASTSRSHLYQPPALTRYVPCSDD